MGNRACVIFYDSQFVSPTVYLHWHGESVPAWLTQLKQLMHDRFGDADYAAARFVGICHREIEGNLSLGLSLQQVHALRTSTTNPCMEDESPGNAGIVVVDTREFTWRAYGGYLADAGRA